MLRKDVKIGFVVGGILIATLIAYVITAGRSKPKAVELAEADAPQQVQAVGSEDQAPSKPEASAPVSSDEQPKPEASAPASTGGSSTEAKPADPFQSSGNTKDVWASALSSGTVLMSMTPSAPTNSAEPAVANTAAVTNTVNADPPPSLLPTTQHSETKKPESHTTTPAIPQSGRTHVIQKGETLTMVAVAVYGDQKYWKQIAAANPSLNPNRLKPGTPINLPDIAAKKATVTAALNGGVSTPTNSKTQYEVQSGDSLRRIALKLYGKESMWQKIYDLNKSEIGADPAKLKLHTVLKLPQAPTSA